MPFRHPFFLKCGQCLGNDPRLPLCGAFHQPDRKLASEGFIQLASHKVISLYYDTFLTLFWGGYTQSGAANSNCVSARTLITGDVAVSGMKRSRHNWSQSTPAGISSPPFDSHPIYFRCSRKQLIWPWDLIVLERHSRLIQFHSISWGWLHKPNWVTSKSWQTDYKRQEEDRRALPPPPSPPKKYTKLPHAEQVDAW